MDVSLCSGLNGAKPVLSCVLANNRRRPPKFIAISCRATKQASENETINFYKEESTRMFVQVHAAYKTLTDPDSREEYDYEMGLSNIDSDDQLARSRWEDQLLELRRRCNCRTTEKEGSWSSRLRAQNRQNGVI